MRDYDLFVIGGGGGERGGAFWMKLEERQDKIFGNIGNNIKKIRNEKKLPQDSLFKKSNSPYTTPTKLESGVITKPTIQTPDKIAGWLNVGIAGLIK